MEHSLGTDCSLCLNRSNLMASPCLTSPTKVPKYSEAPPATRLVRVKKLRPSQPRGSKPDVDFGLLETLANRRGRKESPHSKNSHSNRPSCSQSREGEGMGDPVLGLGGGARPSVCTPVPVQPGMVALEKTKAFHRPLYCQPSATVDDQEGWRYLIWGVQASGTLPLATPLSGAGKLRSRFLSLSSIEPLPRTGSCTLRVLEDTSPPCTGSWNEPEGECTGRGGVSAGGRGRDEVKRCAPESTPFWL